MNQGIDYSCTFKDWQMLVDLKNQHFSILIKVYISVNNAYRISNDAFHFTFAITIVIRDLI